MYPNKRLDFIIEVCYRVRNEIPDFQMIFIGSGIDSYKVKEASDTNEWIRYVGPIFGIDRIKYFKISSIQLMPDFVGLSILDSFAMETPIVTTNTPIHGPEIEYLENGINSIITNGNLDDYSNSVIEVLKTEYYLELIKGCKLSAEKYTIEKMVENFKNGILSVLNNEKSK
jgi:glycosyltransferase involved in cell wall biosynthesis